MIKKKTNTTEQEKQGTIYSENIQIPISKGENNNALIIESNDSEIQQKYIEPNLSQADNSYVVVGIPEISASKIQYEMEENGRHIQILDLSRYVGIATVQYNPLKHIDKHHYREEDVEKIVDCIMRNTLCDSNGHNCHLNALELRLEKALISSLILYLIEIADEDICRLDTALFMAKLANIPSQKAYCSANGFSLDNLLDEVFSGLKKISSRQYRNDKILDYNDVEDKKQYEYQNLLLPSSCLKQYQLFKCCSKETQKKVLASATMRLSLFAGMYSIPQEQCKYDVVNDKIDVSRLDEVDINSLREQGNCLLATYSKANESTKVLTAILISQIYDSLTRESYESHQKNHVKFIVDGVNDACFIPELKCKLTSCQNYNISFDVLLPSITFAEAIYDDWDYISQAFNVYVCFNAIDEYTAEYFIQRGKSNMKNHELPKNRYPTNRIEKILNKDEIIMLPDYACLVVINKIGQYIDNKKW